MIEIGDTANVIFYGFTDKQRQTGLKYEEDRLWYYKSKATMEFVNDKTIWIHTDRFRFDYRIEGDTLVEVDKMGDQGKYIKVVKE